MPQVKNVYYERKSDPKKKGDHHDSKKIQYQNDVPEVESRIPFSVTLMPTSSSHVDLTVNSNEKKEGNDLEIEDKQYRDNDRLHYVCTIIKYMLLPSSMQDKYEKLLTMQCLEFDNEKFIFYYVNYAKSGMILRNI